VRILQGKKTVEVPPETVRELLRCERQIVIDIGTGDGRWPYEKARADAASLYFGLDPDAAAMAEYAFRASRKPARGGVENVVYVVASLEALPPELAGRASLVRVNYPWSGLLRGLLLPQSAALSGLRGLMADGGALELVFTYDASHDSAALDGASLPSLDERYIEETLRPAYRDAGLEIAQVQRLSREEALAIPATWGRRLLHGRERDVYFVRADRA
jgi:16S rRNA (adenine(1408)-N(1))-methyltransferase